MNYKILSFSALTGALEVHFFTQDYPSGLKYNINLPLNDAGQYPIGQELDEYIRRFAPTEQIARLVKLRDNPPAQPEITIEPEPDPVLTVSLAEAISYAERQIDLEASKTRSRYISSGTGQDATYVIKALQAANYRDTGFQGTVPLYIAAEAAATGKTVQEVVNVILATSQLWNEQLGPQIEATRLAGKANVRSATSNALVKERMNAAIAALKAIGT